jgi:hypothetical protein
MAIDPDLPFVLAGLAIIAGTVISVVRTLVNRRPPHSVGAPELRAIEERLDRIEQAIDSIAVETERISEGQRFTTRLLSESSRRSPDAPGDGLGGR